jgi:hypothetical protein
MKTRLFTLKIVDDEFMDNDTGAQGLWYPEEESSDNSAIDTPYDFLVTAASTTVVLCEYT